MTVELSLAVLFTTDDFTSKIVQEPLGGLHLQHELKHLESRSSIHQPQSVNPLFCNESRKSAEYRPIALVGAVLVTRKSSNERSVKTLSCSFNTIPYDYMV